MAIFRRIEKDLVSILNNVTQKGWHQQAFQLGLYASYILTVLLAIGFAYIKPTYLQTLERILQIYVALFLVLRFNPLVRDKMKFNKFDAKVSFSAGIFILFTTVLTSVLEKITNNFHISL